MKTCPDYMGPYCGMFIECPRWLQGDGTRPDIDTRTCGNCDVYRGCANCKRPEYEGIAKAVCRINHKCCDCIM